MRNREPALVEAALVAAGQLYRTLTAFRRQSS
jgi:hypothetical protein